MYIQCVALCGEHDACLHKCVGVQGAQGGVYVIYTEKYTDQEIKVLTTYRCVVYMQPSVIYVTPLIALKCIYSCFFTT